MAALSGRPSLVRVPLPAGAGATGRLLGRLRPVPRESVGAARPDASVSERRPRPRLCLRRLLLQNVRRQKDDRDGRIAAAFGQKSEAQDCGQAAAGSAQRGEETEGVDQCLHDPSAAQDDGVCLLKNNSFYPLLFVKQQLWGLRVQTLGAGSTFRIWVDKIRDRNERINHLSYDPASCSSRSSFVFPFLHSF